jgi:ribonuclease T1
MAKSNRSSTKNSQKTSFVATPPKSPKRRGGGQYGVGGTIATLLLALLYWWFTGSPLPSDGLTTGANDNPPAVVDAATETATAAAVAEAATATEAATVEPTATTPSEPIATATEEPAAAAPTPTVAAPDPTATPQPAPTATKPPKPTPSPTPPARAGPAGMPVITLDELPPEALDTLDLIESDGPFPFERDGITFQNRERLLPQKSRGYYREYTVITPWENDRGARRIIAGANGELYYTDDHYESFYWIVTQ